MRGRAKERKETWKLDRVAHSLARQTLFKSSRSLLHSSRTVGAPTLTALSRLPEVQLLGNAQERAVS